MITLVRVDPPPSWWERIKDILKSLTKYGDGIIGLVLSLASVATALVAFIFMWKGIHKMVFDENSSMHKAIEGIEYLLLAPMGFLIVRSLSLYVKDFYAQGKITHDAKKNFLEIKSMAAGLLFAVLATHMLGKFVQTEETKLVVIEKSMIGKTLFSESKSPLVVTDKMVGNYWIEEKSHMQLQEFIPGMLLLIVLAAYFYSLERVAIQKEKAKNETVEIKK